MIRLYTDENSQSRKEAKKEQNKGRSSFRQAASEQHDEAGGLEVAIVGKGFCQGVFSLGSPRYPAERGKEVARPILACAADWESAWASALLWRCLSWSVWPSLPALKYVATWQRGPFFALISWNILLYGFDPRCQGWQRGPAARSSLCLGCRQALDACSATESTACVHPDYSCSPGHLPATTDRFQTI
jgi:hypothetical protein